MKYSFSSISLITVLLSGCVSHYHPSDDSAKAELISRSNADMVFVQAFENENCDVHPDGSRIGLFTRDSGDEVTAKIQAGKKLFISYILSAGVHNIDSCKVTVGFTPEVGKTYVSEFAVTETKCFLELYETEPNVNIEVRKPVSFSQTDKACFNVING